MNWWITAIGGALTGLVINLAGRLNPKSAVIVGMLWAAALTVVYTLADRL